MKIIKRYELAIEPEQKFKIPFNSEILGVSVVAKKPAIDILIDTDDKEVERKFVIFASNVEVAQRINGTHYIGCFEYKVDVGFHTLHVFEER